MSDLGETVFLAVILLDLLAIAWCDARFRVVPTLLIWPGIALGVVFRAVRGEWAHLVAGLTIAGLLALLSLALGEERAGFGDAEAYGLVGLALGPAVVYVLALASVAAGLYGLARRLRAVAVVPFVAGATLVVVGVELVK